MSDTTTETYAIELTTAVRGGSAPNGLILRISHNGRRIARVELTGEEVFALVTGGGITTYGDLAPEIIAQH